MAFISIENLSFSYPESRKILNSISLNIQEGDFVTVCGPTGCGKTTLLQLLKPQIAPKGILSGKILINNKKINEYSEEESLSLTGFVMQQPEQQIVTDKVWHELSFALENANLSKTEISKRIAEISSFFGIDEWLYKNTHLLSGGQKQILNLASVLVLNPKILVLDEPTSQLDPVSASNFLSVLKRINTVLGITVIIAEHRIEELINISNRLVVLDNGKIVTDGNIQKSINGIIKDGKNIWLLPTYCKLFYYLNQKGNVPLNIQEAKKYIKNNYNNNIKNLPVASESYKEEAIKVSNLFFRYTKEENDVIKNVSFTVKKGEVFSILGGNGAGKSTLLKALCGIIKPYSGSINIFGKNIKKFKNQLYNGIVAYLPQEVENMFAYSTVKEEVDGINNSIIDIKHLYNMHPYDLSGGEKQKVALIKLLKNNPQILLLDEPTKGLDTLSKQEIKNIILSLSKNGTTVIIVTHDVEFAAEVSYKTAMYFMGNILPTASKEEFFSNNNFYTTAVSRITRGYYNNIVTTEDAIKICKLNGEKVWF